MEFLFCVFTIFPMKVYRGTPHAPGGRQAVAIGNFDGVHLGHQALLAGVVRHAAARAGEVPCALTFEPHPREFFHPDNPPARISTLREKAALIAGCGIERLYVARFGSYMAGLSAEDFVREILAGRMAASYVAVGDNFTFGSRGTAGGDQLRRLGERFGIEVEVMALRESDGRSISSSRLREVLAAGDLVQASVLMGHPYRITGRVLHGEELGRTIGIPTLNLRPVPAGSAARPALEGAFATLVSGLVPGKRLPAVTSMGTRPTVSGRKTYTCESHVIGWSGNAYGAVVQVEFLRKLRDNKKFSGLEELQASIRQDILSARRVFDELAREAGRP